MDPTPSESAIPSDNIPSRPVVRILSSELDAELREPLHAFVREAIGNEVWLETLLVENPLDTELLRTAIEHHWDLAILILDNIKYRSNDRGPAAIINGAPKMLRGLRQSSKNPLICFYSWMDDSELAEAALAAGADAVFRMPCKAEDVVPTFKRCLNKFVPPPPLPPPIPPSTPSPQSDVSTGDSSEKNASYGKPWIVNLDDELN